MLTFRIPPARILAAAVVTMAVSTSAAAGARHHKHHDYTPYSSEVDIYLHNYGPAVTPDQPFAYYDGPLRAHCKQGAASYRGQDGRPHPCN